MFTTMIKITSLIRPVITLAGLLIVIGCQQAEESAIVSPEPAPPNVSELVALAVSGIGGEEAQANLNGFSVREERDYYIMGQGPEPGRGLMKLPGASVQVRHDLAGRQLRLDSSSSFPARAGGYDKRESTELIVGQAGYLNADDFLGIGKRRDKPSTPDRTAGTIKTERLLNPHILVNEALNNPSSVSIAADEADQSTGRLFTDADVFPVTLERVRQTGKRTLIVTEKWLRRSEGTRFYDLMVEKTQLDADWLSRWREDTQIDEAAHHQLVIKDEVFPITLFISKESGRISKLKTMEWDVVYGDVPLEVNYYDWQAVDGVYFPNRIRVSTGGAPRIDVKRSEMTVNPDFDDTTFTPPEGIDYQHDEEVAARARQLSQSLLMFGFAGVGRPSIEAVELKPGLHLLFAAPVDGVYTFVIEQEKSLVVMEPGQNDLKGEEIINWIAERYPDKPISHLIVSHHHNDHAAGIRPYIAAGATLVTHEAAVDFYKAQASRLPSKVLQDALDRNPMAAKIVGVPSSEPYRIDDALQPVVIYPLEMGHVSDMLFAVVEHEKLLYAGDLYVSGLARDLRAGKKRPTNILPFHAAVSLDEGIRAYGLNVTTLVGSHDRQSVTYADLLDYISDDE